MFCLFYLAKSRAESTAQLGSGSSSHHANKSRRKTPSGSGAILNSNLERNSDILNRSQNSKSASSSSSASLMPPPSGVPPNLTSMVTSPVLAGASGTIPTLTSEQRSHSGGGSRPLLINPNTGVLESGPSESSSEGEGEHYDQHSSSSGTTPPGASPTSNRTGLKMKLKLPVTPPQATSNSTSSDSSNSGGVDSGGGGTPSGGPDRGPKLPKLILSMRDKTVKQKFSNKSSSNSSAVSNSVDVKPVVNHLNDSSDNSENGSDFTISEQKLKKIFIPKNSSGPVSKNRTLDQNNESNKNFVKSTPATSSSLSVIKTEPKEASSSTSTTSTSKSGVTISPLNASSSSTKSKVESTAQLGSKVNNVISSLSGRTSSTSLTVTTSSSAAATSVKSKNSENTSTSSSSSITAASNTSATSKKQPPPNSSLVKEWTKSLSNHTENSNSSTHNNSNTNSTRLDKGAFNDLHENNFNANPDEDGDEDMEDLDEKHPRGKSFSGLKGSYNDLNSGFFYHPDFT